MPTFLIPAGSVQLEAQLREPKGELRGAVVVCHPHPVYGGTMDNHIVYRSAKAAAEAGFAALRFNFRGVGRSTGQFDQGIGEREDAAAAIRWLENRYPEAGSGDDRVLLWRLGWAGSRAFQAANQSAGWTGASSEHV